MEKEIKIIDSTKQELILKFSKADVEPAYNEAYRKAQAQIEMPGFRKGKVPVHMIKQRFGAELEADAQQEIVNQHFSKIVQDEKIYVVGHPALTDIAVKDGGFEAKVEYEVMPDFELSEYKGITLDEPVHRVSDEEIDGQINNILTNAGKVEPAKQILDEQFIAGLKFVELDKDSKEPLPENKPYETNVYLADPQMTPALRQSLMNLKIGDSFLFNPKEADSNSPDKLYKIEVNSIEKLVPREFTNEFVEEYTKGKFMTTEELREEIGYKLQEDWDHKSRHALEDQLVAKLVDDNNFKVPQGVVEEVVRAMASDVIKRYKNSPQKPEFSTLRKELAPIAERNVRWEMIRQKIAENEGIKVEEHDIEAFIEKESERYQTSKETIRRAIMENQQLIQSLLAQKVIDYVLDFSVTNEVEFHEHHDHDHAHLSPYNPDEDEYADDEFEDEDDDLDEDFDDEDFDDEDFDEEEFDEEFDETVDPDELYEEEADDEDEDDKVV